MNGVPYIGDVSLSNLEYKDLSMQKNGAKVAYVTTVKGSSSYNDRLRFQLNKDTNILATATWGLSKILPGQDASKRMLELTIEDEETFNTLTKLDNMNIQVAVDNSETWFKKKLDVQTIKDMYVPIVKPRAKIEFKDSVKVKVKCEELPTEIWVVQEEIDNVIKYTVGTLEDLSKGTKILAIVETSGLWFMSRQFGMSFTAKQLLVWPNKITTGINAFTLSEGQSLMEVDQTSM